MKLPSTLRRSIVSASAAAFLAVLGRPIHAETYTWVQTSGGPYDWNAAANWNPSTGFPIASSEVANVTTDLTAALTIRLRQPISVGTLNLGDTSASAASFGFTIGNLTGETHALTFDSGEPNVAAKLNLQSTGIPINTISAPVLLNSPLAVNMGGSDLTNAQRLVFSNTVSTQDQPITLTGGVFNNGSMTISGALLGGAAALVTNNSLSPLVLSVANPDYTGKFVINNRATGSNQAGLTLTTGSIANASELVINGYLSAGITQNGGGVHSGNNNGAANNPGQRFTQNRITLNGGTLNANGQLATTGILNPWQQGLEAVQDNVATMDFNSGFSHVVMSLGGNTAGTILNIATVERSPGASLYLRSSTLGQANGSKFLVGNANAFMLGAGGAVGTTTMSIIPWLAANNTGSGTGVPTGFATNTPNGIRALFTAGEYAVQSDLSTVNNGANVDVGNFNLLTAPKTINSLRLTGGASNIGVGQVLTLASGGLFFTNNGSVGAAGNAAAGTLDFGSAEGVVWSNGTNTNGIGASITGTGGLSKAGTGTLTLTGGANTYSGLTYVGGGLLQVGNGTNLSTLGLSNEVVIAAGAGLSLVGGNMILDTATLRLEQYGLFNGKVTLFPDLNETIGALYLGDTLMPVGTYGAVGSQADFENDTWFTGTGVLTVVAEPGSAVLLLGGIAMVAGRRRRK